MHVEPMHDSFCRCRVTWYLAQVPGAKTAGVHGLCALLVLQVGRWKHMRIYTHEARLNLHLPCLHRQAATPLGIPYTSSNLSHSPGVLSPSMPTPCTPSAPWACYGNSTLTVGSRGSLPYSFTAFSIICSRTWGAVPACRQTGQRVIERPQLPAQCQLVDAAYDASIATYARPTAVSGCQLTQGIAASHQLGHLHATEANVSQATRSMACC